MPLPVQHWYRAPERLTSQGEVRGIVELTLQEKLTSPGEVRGIMAIVPVPYHGNSQRYVKYRYRVSL